MYPTLHARKGSRVNKIILAAVFATAWAMNASAISIQWGIAFSDGKDNAIPADTFIQKYTQNPNSTYFAVLVQDFIYDYDSLTPAPGVQMGQGKTEIALSHGQEISGIVMLNNQAFSDAGFQAGPVGERDTLDGYVYEFDSPRGAGWGDSDVFWTLNPEFMEQAGEKFSSGDSLDLDQIDSFIVYYWLYIFEAPSGSETVDDATGYWVYPTLTMTNVDKNVDGEWNFGGGTEGMFIINPIPEPATAALLALGAVLIGLRRRKRND